MSAPAQAMRYGVRKTIEADLDLESVMRAVAKQNLPVILESGLHVGCGGRYSVVACEPRHVVECEIRKAQDLEKVIGRLRTPSSAGRTGACQPYGGGWFGFISYEAGLALEGISRVRGEAVVPDVRWAYYDVTAVFDSLERRWLICTAPDPFGVDSEVEDRAEKLAALITDAGVIRRDRRPSFPARQVKQLAVSVAVESSMPRPVYLANARRILEYILAGDAYQVNLTQQWSARTDRSPIENYLRLRQITPAPYSAFLQWGDTAILSASPELFLEVRDGQVITRPIKGTRPRSGDGAADEAARRELETSEKDEAELNMIVDVMRNDLGRVCEYGSVEVVSAGEIEEHPTVFHRVATIGGRLRPEVEQFELLQACLPGASVTGAPKIRAMQIISELETVPRGVYCGALGWMGGVGGMSLTLNLPIRTMVQRGNQVFLHAGGGIVADSDVEAEYEESLTKLWAMRACLAEEEAWRLCI